MNAPNREGWWRWDSQCKGDRSYDVEVYHGPNDALCVWCEDIGVGSYTQTISEGDEMMGHIIAWGLDGEWTYLRPFDEPLH